jgi:glycosyltransferase involved in cell wall biosynthesis
MTGSEEAFRLVHPGGVAKLPHVSVITPSFNQGAFLEATIRSVLDQGYPSLEYIIIDGGSTDNSVEIIRAYSDKLTFWCSEKDSGQSSALNRGLRLAKGEFIGWLNSDDVYYPGSILTCVRQLLDHSDADIVFGNYDYINASGSVVHRRREIPYDFNTYFWTGTCYHANVAALYRKSCFERFGYVREDLHYSMDYELYLRLGYNGCKFLQEDKPLGAYRLHNSSKTVSSYARTLSEAESARKEFFDMMRPSALARHILPKYYVALRLIRKLFRGCYSVGNIRSLSVFAAIKRRNR